MTRSQQWRSALLLLLLPLVAACGGDTDGTQSPEEQAEGRQASVLPQRIAVTISDGAFAPDPIAPNPGDTVAFMASGDDVVLCVDPASLFGAERYAIPNGETLDVTVQPGAIHVDFAYAVCVGDLDAACGTCRGGEGGGRTGP